MLPRSFNKVRRPCHNLWPSLSYIGFLRSSRNFCSHLVIAREYRTKRVREARDEAKKEIDDYRKSKEDEFKKFESEHAAGNKQAEDEANKEAETKITEIKSAGKKSQDKVVADLLKAVFEVKPVPPTAA
jgi:V-type H+-transporting ATPase subunit G